jgi:hypothetical protein
MLRVQCEVEGCNGLVVNLRRHTRLCHPDLVEERAKTEKKRIYEPTDCERCGLVTNRLDLYLPRMWRGPL